MPTFPHEVLLLLFRNRPTLAAEVLRDVLGVPVPAFAEARIESGDLSEPVPVEHRADLVVLLLDGRPVLAVVVEAQLSRNAEKRYAWPSYLVEARARFRCPAYLLVVTIDAAVAAWCAEPIELNAAGSVVRPLVLGPQGVPVVTEPETACARPELAVLSAMAHGQGEVGLAIATAALTAAAGLDQDRATLYEDIVLASLNEAARRALEAMMAIGNYEYQSELVRRNVAKGRDQGREEGALQAKVADVLAVLETRGLPIPEEVRERVRAGTDAAELDRWLRRAVLVSSAAEIFESA